MSRTEKFIKNTFTTGLYQIVLMLSGFILPKVMLSYYGSEINGLVTSIAQFIQYITLVEAGLSGAAVYALYKPLADNDTREISRVVVATKKFYAKSGFAFVGLVAALAIIYPLIARTESLGYLDISVLVLVIGVSGTLDFFLLGKYRAILTADQKQYVISFAMLLYCVLNVFLIVLFTVWGYGIVFSRIIALFAVLVRSMVLSIYCRKNYGYLDYSAEPNVSALNKRWDALYLQILGVIHTGAPVILSTVLTSLASVSVYSVYNLVMSGLGSILSIFNSGLGAGFGELIARKETKKLQNAYLDFEFAYYALITLIYSVAMIQIIPFVELYTKGVSDADYIQPFLGFLFVLNGFLFCIKTPQGMLVISAGLYRETRIQTTLQGAIAVVGGILLGSKYGLTGIVTAMCLSNLYRDIDLVLFIPKYVTCLKVIETLKNIALSFAEMFLIVGFGRIIPWNNESAFYWILNSIVIVCYSAIIIFGISFLANKKRVLNVARRVKSILKRR